MCINTYTHTHTHTHTHTQTQTHAQTHTHTMKGHLHVPDQGCSIQCNLNYPTYSILHMRDNLKLVNIFK